MKRRELIALLQRGGCVLVREGSKHSWYKNPSLGLRGSLCAVPRHVEVKRFTAKGILVRLGVPLPPGL